jgi:hypothetical protein
MAWNGEERRKREDRRLSERRRTMRYNVQTLLIVDGVTWVDHEGNERRHHIRRRDDREWLARKIIEKTRP